MCGPGPGNVEVTLGPADADKAADKAGREVEAEVARLLNTRQAGLGTGEGAEEGWYRSRDAVGCRARLLFDNGQVAARAAPVDIR